MERRHQSNANPQQMRVPPNHLNQGQNQDTWHMDQSYKRLKSFEQASFNQQEDYYQHDFWAPLNPYNGPFSSSRPNPRQRRHEVSRGLNMTINNKNNKPSRKFYKKYEGKNMSSKAENSPLFGFFALDLIQKGYIRLSSKSAHSQIIVYCHFKRREMISSTSESQGSSKELRGCQRAGEAKPHTLGSRSALFEIKGLVNNSNIEGNHFRENLVFNVWQLPGGRGSREHLGYQ